MDQPERTTPTSCDSVETCNHQKDSTEQGEYSVKEAVKFRPLSLDRVLRVLTIKERSSEGTGRGVMRTTRMAVSATRPKGQLQRLWDTRPRVGSTRCDGSFLPKGRISPQQACLSLGDV